MKENKYDEEMFFEKYSKMERSQKGLQGAGEWSELKKILPDFRGRRVLDRSHITKMEDSSAKRAAIRSRRMYASACGTRTSLPCLRGRKQ